MTAVIECPQGHGAMVRRELAATPEQRWCGTWYDCPPGLVPCRSSVLVPSAELLEFLRQQGLPGRELSPQDRAECADEAAWKRHTDH